MKVLIKRNVLRGGRTSVSESFPRLFTMLKGSLLEIFAPVNNHT